MHPATTFAFAAAISVCLMGCVGLASTDASYVPPQASAADESGWESYVDAPTVDAASADGINPRADTPEAAVVEFLASRVRGDGEWRGAIVAAPSDRTKRQLEHWDNWTLERFQLRGRKARDADTVSIKVFFEISIDGRSDAGEDEFEVVLEGDQWRIASPPA